MILAILHAILAGLGYVLLAVFGFLALIVVNVLVVILAIKVLQPFNPYIDRLIAWALK